MDEVVMVRVTMTPYPHPGAALSGPTLAMRGMLGQTHRGDTPWEFRPGMGGSPILLPGDPSVEVRVCPVDTGFTLLWLKGKEVCTDRVAFYLQAREWCWSNSAERLDDWEPEEDDEDGDGWLLEREATATRLLTYVLARGENAYVPEPGRYWEGDVAGEYVLMHRNMTTSRHSTLDALREEGRRRGLKWADASPLPLPWVALR